MDTRDWSSTEFVASAATIAGVWTTGLKTGADSSWTVAATTGLAIVYVLAKGFQNRQSGQPPWSRSELFVAAAQVIAVAAAATQSKAPTSTAVLAIGLTIASYMVAYVISVAHLGSAASNPPPDGGAAMGTPLLAYDPPLSTFSRPPTEPAGAVNPRSDNSIRIERRSAGSVSVYSSSRSGGSLPLGQLLSAEHLVQFLEAGKGAPVGDRMQVLDRLQSGRKFAVRAWHAEQDEMIVTRIARDPGSSEATLLSREDEPIAAIKVPAGEAAEDLDSFQMLLTEFELPLCARRAGSRTALLGVESP